MVHVINRLRRHAFAPLLIMTAVLVIGGCGGGDGQQVSWERATPVGSTVVVLERAVVQRDLSGILRGEMEANVAPQISGRLTRVNVEIGDAVRRGQALAVLDGSQYWHSTQASRSQVESARLQLEQAEDNYARYKPLYESDKISRSQWDQIVTGLELARAGFNAARAGYNQVANLAGETTIRAPFDGVVASRNADVGSMVGPQMVVFQVVQTNPMKVTIGVDEKDLRYLTEAAEVEVWFEAYPEEVFIGRIRSIGVKLDSGTHTFPVEVTVPNVDGRLKSGMVAHVVLPIRDLGEVISVPLNAVVDIGGTHYVYVVQETPKAAPGAALRQLRVGDEVVRLNSQGADIASALGKAGSGAEVTLEFDGQIYTLTLTDISAATSPGESEYELRAERRPVALGPTLGDRIVISAGLEPGERIVTEGHQFLDDGALITLPGADKLAPQTTSSETVDDGDDEDAVGEETA